MYVLREFHGSGLAGHSGKNKTLKMIGEFFYWKGMCRDVVAFINGCVMCRERKRPKPNRQGEVGQLIVGEVFHTLAMDIITQLPDDNGHKHILSIIDVFTRYAWAIPLKTREATEVADALAKNILHEHGAFRILRTDNEKSFISNLMKRLLDKWSIAHLTTVPYHSESNGHVERLHKFLEVQLTILAKSREKWTDHLNATTFAYNASVHSSTGYSPYFLWHGRRPRLPVECILDHPTSEMKTPEEHADKLMKVLTDAYKMARKEQRKAAERRKKIQAGVRKPTVFKANDTVMYHESERGTAAKHLPRKMAKNASGPHKVLRRIDANRYVIHHRNRNCEVIVSVKDISKYSPFCKYEDEALRKPNCRLETWQSSPSKPPMNTIPST
jgi:transposase InsO family protein